MSDSTHPDCNIDDLKLKDRMYELFEARKLDTPEGQDIKIRYHAACEEFVRHMNGRCNAK